MLRITVFQPKGTCKKFTDSMASLKVCTNVIVQVSGRSESKVTYTKKVQYCPQRAQKDKESNWTFSI